MAPVAAALEIFIEPKKIFKKSEIDGKVIISRKTSAAT
jgi:hypothetical protein